MQYLKETPLDGVIFAGEDTEKLRELMRKCQIMGLPVHIVNGWMSSLRGETSTEKLGGVPVISASAKLVTGKELFCKRLMDIVGSVIGLLILGCSLVFIAPAIHNGDPGPIFFKQKRIGKGGVTFDFYKIRTMYANAEERKRELLSRNRMNGCMFKVENDPRIIGSGADGTGKGIGWFLRTYSLDEMAQFWNTLRGDMSLVGTRPPTVDEWERYDLHQRARMCVWPGITGWWQVSGRSDITDFEEVVRMDQEYIRRWSLWLDVKILLRTFVVVLRRQGAM